MEEELARIEQKDKSTMTEERETRMEEKNYNIEDNIIETEKDTSIQQEKPSGTQSSSTIIEDGMSFIGYIKRSLKLPDTDIKTYSPLTLAFIGDSIFDLIIRTFVVESGNAPVNKLHHRCSKLVQAGAQAELYHSIKDMLTEEEMAVFKRGRNAKSFTSAKNAGLLEYRTATGLEALMGYLYLTDRMERIMELMQYYIFNVKIDS